MALIQMISDTTTLRLNGHLFNDLAEGVAVEFESPNAATSRVNGASSNAVNIAPRSDRNVRVLKIRVQKGGADDVFLNSALNQSAPVVFNGSTRDDYRRDGSAFSDAYTLENGSITTQPTDSRNTQEHEGAMEYYIEFRNVVRNL